MSSPKFDKKKILSIAIIVVAFGATGVLLFKSLSGPSSPEPTVIPISPTRVSRTTSDTTPSGVPQSEAQQLQGILSELRQYGEWPVTVPDLGRANPFVPVE